MHTYTVFLRVRHPSLDPAELTRVLGLVPAHAWAAGSPRASGAAGRTAHGESYWFAPLGEASWPRAGAGQGAGAGESWQLASQALPLGSFLHAQIRPLARHCALFARIAAEGGSSELVVTLGARDRLSIELPPRLLRSLADLGIAITLDVGTGEEPVSH